MLRATERLILISTGRIVFVLALLVMCPLQFYIAIGDVSGQLVGPLNCLVGSCLMLAGLRWIKTGDHRVRKTRDIETVKNTALAVFERVFHRAAAVSVVNQTTVFMSALAVIILSALRVVSVLKMTLGAVFQTITPKLLPLPNHPCA